MIFPQLAGGDLQYQGGAEAQGVCRLAVGRRDPAVSAGVVGGGDFAVRYDDGGDRRGVCGDGKGGSIRRSGRTMVSAPLALGQDKRREGTQLYWRRGGFR